MNNRIVRLGMVAVAAAAIALIGIILLTRSDSGAQAGAQLTPSSAQTDPGTLAMSRISGTGDNYDLYRVHSDGTGLRRLTAGPGSEVHARWSPDGTRIVYAVSEANRSRIFAMNADGSGKLYLGDGGSPSWSPDGRQILYDRFAIRISVMNADGSHRRVVLGAPFWPAFATWAPNGKIVFVRIRASVGWMYGGERPSLGGDLYAVNPDGSGLERLTTGARMLLPSVSPDGSTIAAYARKTDSLIAMPFRADGPAVTLVARASQYFPTGGNPMIVSRWTADGKKLVLGSDYGGGGLYVVNTDGSGLTMIPGLIYAIEPDWRPLTGSDTGAELTHTPTLTSPPPSATVSRLDVSGDGQVRNGLLDPGTYTYFDVDGQGFNVQFTVPADWTWNGRYLSKGGVGLPDGAAIFFYGGPVQVDAESFPGTPADVMSEIEAILGSIYVGQWG